MFLRRSEPVLLTEAGLEGLCASLNRPVVDVEDLPVGPARSAIALHRDGQGRRGLIVTLRSEDSGGVVYFEFEGELNDDPHQALDVGLSFAEGMGFLFDEDMLAGGDPTRRRLAIEHWCRLTGDELPGISDSVAAPASTPAPQADGDGSLLLHDLVEGIDEDLGGQDDAEGLDFEEELPPMQESAVLTKFRRSPSPAAPEAPRPAAPAAPGAPAELARIPILRRRRPASDAETPPLLTRLLARF